MESRKRAFIWQVRLTRARVNGMLWRMEYDSTQSWRAPESGSARGDAWKMAKKILGLAGVIVVVVFKFFAQLKFLILPVLKFFPLILKTGGSMVLTIGVYAMSWGWKFAVGFVLLLLVHECGHLVMARIVGLKVGAPVFIPFMGAFIALKEAPRNAWIEAQVGLGGPFLGTIGAAACDVAYRQTGYGLLQALAYTGYFLNLFNLAPLGFLDGGRIVTALSPWLWLVGLLVVGTMVVTHFNFLLLLILLMSLPRIWFLFRRKTEEEQRYFEVTLGQRCIIAVFFFGLTAYLVLAMGVVGTQTGTV
jgi:Zn-dependent protease